MDDARDDTAAGGAARGGQQPRGVFQRHGQAARVDIVTVVLFHSRHQLACEDRFHVPARAHKCLHPVGQGQGIGGLAEQLGGGLVAGFAAGGPRAIDAIKRLRAYGGAPIPLPLQHASAALWRDRVPDADAHAVRISSGAVSPVSRICAFSAATSEAAIGS